MGTSGSKGESMTVVVEAGAEDTGSDSYRQSDKEGGGVRSARALPVQLPLFGNHSHAPAHSSHVSHVPHVSHPCPLSHLGPITEIPSALARVPTPLPASLISLFPLKTYLIPCFAE